MVNTAAIYVTVVIKKVVANEKRRIADTDP